MSRALLIFFVRGPGGNDLTIRRASNVFPSVLSRDRTKKCFYKKNMRDIIPSFQKEL